MRSQISSHRWGAMGARSKRRLLRDSPEKPYRSGIPAPERLILLDEKVHFVRELHEGAYRGIELKSAGENVAGNPFDRDLNRAVQFHVLLVQALRINRFLAAFPFENPGVIGIEPPDPVHEAIRALHGTIIPFGVLLRGPDEKGVNADRIGAVGIDQGHGIHHVSLALRHFRAVSMDHPLGE